MTESSLSALSTFGSQTLDCKFVASCTRKQRCYRCSGRITVLMFIHAPCLRFQTMIWFISFCLAWSPNWHQHFASFYTCCCHTRDPSSNKPAGYYVYTHTRLWIFHWHSHRLVFLPVRVMMEGNEYVGGVLSFKPPPTREKGLDAPSALWCPWLDTLCDPGVWPEQHVVNTFL